MESFIEEYIRTEYDDVSTEHLLERRLSPYATLRPGDLSTLLKLHAALPFPGTGSCRPGSYKNVSHLGGDHGLIKEQPYEDRTSDDEPPSPTVNDLQQEVTCLGSDQSHVPAVYKVKGIHVHEMPVIGVYVDPRVCPGFKYRVRRAGESRSFYGGRPRTLESLGMGYGRRITFAGDSGSLNSNDAFFWSDSHPEGFAFSISAVEPGQGYLIADSQDVVVGEATVTHVTHPQAELSMTSSKVTGVTKKVKVTMTLQLTYYHRHHHGLVEMTPHEGEETVTGEAELHKGRGQREAQVTLIDSVYLQRLGNCKLLPGI